MIGTVVAKFHLESFGTAGQSHDLMAQANAEGRDAGFNQFCGGGYRIVTRLRITRAIAQKDAIWLMFEDVCRAAHW